MNNKLINGLEAILFVSGEAVSRATLQKTLNISSQELSEAVEEYAEVLKERAGALTLVFDVKYVRLAVQNEYTSHLEALQKSELQEGLSKAALEVLALVAYLAPVARVEIDAIRGVNSSFTLRNLTLRGLIDRRGNPEDARGFVYEPSMDFLLTLGIERIEDLPEYQKLKSDKRIQLLLGKIGEDEVLEGEKEYEEG